MKDVRWIPGASSPRGARPGAPALPAAGGWLLALLLSSPASSATAIPWPDWDALAARHPGAAAVLLVDESEVTFDRLGNGRFGRIAEARQLVALLDPARAGAWTGREVLESGGRRVLALEGRTWTSAARSIPARVTTAAAVPGDPVYENVRARRVAFEGVRPRTVIELHTREESPDDYYVEHRFAHDIPTESSALVLLVPRGLLAQGFEQGVRAFGLSADPVASLQPGESGDLRAFRWEARDLPALPDAPLAPGPAELSPWVRIAPNLFGAADGNWFEMGRRYYDATFAPQLKPSAAVTELAGRLAAGGATPLERVRAIAAWVRSDVRTAALPLGIDSYRPNLPASALAQRMGDAKDKVALLLALLREAGFEGRPALLRRRPLGPADTTLLHLGQFDHVVAWIPLGSEGMWLDPSASFAAPGWLPAEDQGTLAFVAGPEGGRFLATPVSPPELSVTDTRLAGALGADGTLTGAIEVRAAGEAAQRLRAALAGLSEGARRERVAASFTARAAGARVGPVALAGVDSLDRPLVMRFDVEWPRFAVDESMSEVPFLPADWTAALAPASRVTPIRFPVLEQHRLRLTIVPPPGARLVPAPPESQEGVVFSFHRDGRIENGARVEEFVVQNEVFLVPESELPAARAEYARLRAALSRPLRLERP